MNIRSLLSHTLLASLVVTASLRADSSAASSEPVVKLDAYRIDAERDGSLTSPTLDAARAELRLTPGGVETIDSARYLVGRASTVDDTLALSPGVVAISRFGSDEARLSIRGSGLQRTFHGRGLRVLQAGVPLNLAAGGFDMQAFEPTSASHINVYRGGNALALGGSTLGGAIDYISRTGRTSPGTSTRVEAGSWDYYRANLATSGTRGNLDAFASYTFQTQDGFRDHAQQKNHRVFANSGLRLGKNAETRFYLTAVRTDSELPGSLTKAQLNANPRQGSFANNQKRDFDLLRVTNKTTLRTGNTTCDFSAAWSYKDLDHPIFQVIDQLANDLLLHGSVTHVGQIFNQPNRLRAGLLYQRGNTNSANFANVAGQRGALLADADQVATNLEAYAEDQLALGADFTLVAGFAASRNVRDNERVLNGNPSYRLAYDRVMPKLGLRYDLARDVQFFTNVSASYEPPSFSETLTANAPRDAQTATTVELGSRGASGFFRWDATLYHSALKNEFLALDHDNNPSTAAVTINADRTTHRGAELGFEIDLLGQSFSAAQAPARRVVLRTAWTYGRFRFDDDARYGNNTLAGLPPHLINSELSYETASGWYAGPTVRWCPEKTYIDFRNTFAADAYAVYGFRIGRRQADGLSWFVEARNLADKAYANTTGVIENAASADQTQFLPGDGRSFYVGLSYHW